MKYNSTRRQFIKGLALAAGASALPVSLMGCNSSTTGKVGGIVDWEEDALEWMHKLDLDVYQHSEGYQYLYDSAHTIGHRLAGTDNVRKAEKYIEGIFNDLDIDVEFQQFDCELWVYDSHSTDLDVDGGKELNSALLTWGPESASGQGQVIYIGDGNSDDWQSVGDDAKGKVVLLPNKVSGGESIAERIIKAEEYGCVAALVMGERPHNSPMQVGVVGGRDPKRSLIPCYSLGDKDSIDLRDRIQAKEIINLSFDAQSHVVNSITNPLIEKEKNIIATIPGSEKPEEVIIIGGHLDSWALGDGSVDNGVGIYQIIDIARAFKSIGFQPKRTVKFVMWGAEEQGLYGSRYQAHKLWEDGEIDNVKFVINIDMKCVPTGYNCLGREDTMAYCAQAGQNMQLVDAEYANEHTFKSFGLSSDHRPFVYKGIPTVLPIPGTEKDFTYLTYHSKDDLIDAVKEEYLVDSARRMGAFVMDLANSDSLPPRYTAEQTKAMLTQYGFNEDKLGDDWALIVD